MIPTITKKDVARRAAAIKGDTMYKAEPWAAAVIEALCQLMTEADPAVRIELRDFGIFEVTAIKERHIFDPRAGRKITVPARRRARFKPSKRMNAALHTPLEEPS